MFNLEGDPRLTQAKAAGNPTVGSLTTHCYTENKEKDSPRATREWGWKRCSPGRTYTENDPGAENGPRFSEITENDPGAENGP